MRPGKVAHHRSRTITDKSRTTGRVQLDTRSRTTGRLPQVATCQAHLGGPRAVFQRPGCFGDPLGGLLGAFWRPRGAVWAPLLAILR
eukprot:3727175-Pyramimonas_sp.AAC.1